MGANLMPARKQEQRPLRLQLATRGRPLVQVTLTGPSGRQVEVTAIVDTGCDFVAVRNELLNEIEAPILGTNRCDAVAGTVTTLERRATLAVDGGEPESIRVVGLPWNHVGVDVLLGRAFFHDKAFLYDGRGGGSFAIARLGDEVEVAAAE